ncbi:hypothetical protein DPEC_G00006810 [Dallia pectoralis]|uniref:Uncharacterized protein n=1 Tax=Dallia pectoralis TaxID=75939 RepID=A0ACC2HKK3_DALPE|nr:hypothetical protein DPEC_G00006810 [Dallia pectoralis]
MAEGKDTAQEDCATSLPGFRPRQGHKVLKPSRRPSAAHCEKPVISLGKSNSSTLAFLCHPQRLNGALQKITQRNKGSKELAPGSSGMAKTAEFPPPLFSSHSHSPLFPSHTTLLLSHRTGHNHV